MFIVCTVIVLTFAVHQVWSLLELLFINGIGDAILQSDVPPVGSELADDVPSEHLIPKILHQTYINTSVPLVWQEAQASCLKLHPKPEWEYKLWTDDMSLDFIAEHYPEFSETFKNYRYPIERADAIRYFVLDYYGGVYIDLDDGCQRPLEPLLKYPAFVRKTSPTGVSNDAMGGVPGHPFFKLVTEELKRYDRSWILPYITVMASTGPLFLSVIWRHYSDDGFNVGDGKDGGRVRILFQDMYQGKPRSFFTHHMGNSWHAYDVQLIFWVWSATTRYLVLANRCEQMSRHWIFMTVFGFVLGFSLLLLGWYAYHQYFLKAPSDIPPWKSQSIRNRIPFWARQSTRREYELVNRHEI